ncbi:MAG: bifunctional demethylmenaquinone methyltransferase/2-methoxy-6-polyprenyl-1,4-benzoquinol methylase UbiE [Phycisphaerales bacterium]|nr:bifunctional demethylmenaquinone methyltransferase/2-methoxy-6-polyprenyl-1,4-benzoquinol methylase UbiE [Phycisphaerales bacterium]
MTQETKEDSNKPPAWSGEDLASDPHDASDKASRVEAMFSSIASRYDLNNRIHSLWLDQYWRKKAVANSEFEEGQLVVDVACGTGDLSIAFAKAGATDVVGIDFSQEMLDLAVKKATEMDLAIDFRVGDAMALELPDESVDILSIAFGIRNVQDPKIAISEFYRVLRPKGRVVILEFSTPKQPVIKFLNNIYTKHIMPRTASFIAGDEVGAYRYLPKSVETFLDAKELGNLAREAGFSMVIQKPLSFGVCTLTIGLKTAE